MIKRYRIGCGPDDCPDTEEDPNGEWVLWKDVEALLSDDKNEILEKFLRNRRILKALELSYGLKSTSSVSDNFEEFLRKFCTSEESNE